MWTNTKLLPILGVAAFSLFTGVLNATDDPVRPAPTGALVDVGGYRVHLYCTGSGSPTVVVVGGGFSFDWELVQSPVARTTRICTYDPSGTTWSDPPPRGMAAAAEKEHSQTVPNCQERVAELHELLRRASINGPYVIVGFSIGGLYGRLYAGKYTEDVAGMVVIDHAFIDSDLADVHPASTTPAESNGSPVRQHGAFTVQGVDTPPVLVSQSPIALGIEDDQNFQRLPRRNRDLHRWALSLGPIRPTADTAAECAEAVERTSMLPYPLGMRPLVVISTNNDSPAYQRLQARLLNLSRDHKQIVAERSTHMILVDAPETVVTAICEVVAAVRSHKVLQVEK